MTFPSSPEFTSVEHWQAYTQARRRIELINRIVLIGSAIIIFSAAAGLCFLGM